MSKKALIFGITGQTGSYLADILLEKGYEVHGVIRRHSHIGGTVRIDHIFDKIKLYYGDVTDPLNTSRLISEIKADEIYNLAAQSISNDSLCPIKEPCKGISYKTLECLWNEQVKKRGKIINVDSCGINIEIINIPKKIRIQALGYYNGMGTWFKINQISRHKYKGQICKLKQKFGSIKVTPNHSILDANQKVKMPIENPWLLNVRKINYNRDIKDEIVLSLNKKTNKYKTDKHFFWLNENGKPGKVKKVISKKSLYHFCKFMGSFITEGHTTYNKSNDSYFVGISEQRKEWLEDIENSLNYFYSGNRCYVRHKKKRHSDVYELQIKSRTLYELMRNLCGISSKTKMLPDWFSRLNDKNLNALFNKMIEGDGCYNKNGTYRYTTASYKLACQFSLLNTFIGYDYTVHEEDGGFYHFRSCYSYFPQQGKKGKKVEMLDYDNYVYDISVEEVNNFTTGVGNIVVHNSHVKVSFEEPFYTSQVDGTGTLNIVEAIRLYSNNSVFIQASTSELYGGMNYNRPEKGYNEDSYFHPRSPYGVAKLYGYWIVRNYRESYGLKLNNTICFNHESPRRAHTFVTRKITSAFANIKKGKENILTLGNLDAKRDWGHAFDYANGMVMIAENQESDDFVLATNETHTIREFVEEAAKYCDWEIEWKGEGVNEKGYDKKTGKVLVEINPKYYRPAEVDLLLGDYSKIKNKLGWEPKTTFKKLVEIMMKHDLNSD